jgi:hypothetical protein
MCPHRPRGLTRSRRRCTSISPLPRPTRRRTTRGAATRYRSADTASRATAAGTRDRRRRSRTCSIRAGTRTPTCGAGPAASGMSGSGSQRRRYRRPECPARRGHRARRARRRAATARSWPRHRRRARRERPVECRIRGAPGDLADRDRAALPFHGSVLDDSLRVRRSANGGAESEPSPKETSPKHQGAPFRKDAPRRSRCFRLSRGAVASRPPFGILACSAAEPRAWLALAWVRRWRDPASRRRAKQQEVARQRREPGGRTQRVATGRGAQWAGGAPSEAMFMRRSPSSAPRCTDDWGLFDEEPACPRRRAALSGSTRMLTPSRAFVNVCSPTPTHP